jgi:hypothetical protein
MEITGVDHLDVAKHPYVQFLIFENLLIKMSYDLCLNATDTKCDTDYDSREKNKKSFYDTTSENSIFYGRKLSVKATEAWEYLNKKLKG